VARAWTDLQGAGRRPGTTRPGRRAGVQGRRRAAKVASTAESSSVASMAPPCVRRGDWVVDSGGARLDGGWSRPDGEKAADGFTGGYARSAGWLVAARGWGGVGSDAAYGGVTAQEERGSAAARTQETAGMGN